MDILDDMGVSKLSAKVFFFFKVNYSFKLIIYKTHIKETEFTLTNSSLRELYSRFDIKTC